MFPRGTLKAVELELSNFCNLACPLCSRELISKIDQINNSNLTVDFIEKLCSQLKNRGECVDYTISGVFGDPLSNPDLIPIIKTLSQNKSSFSTITTNGSLRDRVFWKELGELNKSFKNFRVEFSIDGLEDTNPHYRKNSSFDLILENAHTFISNGGRATWKMVIFSHNGTPS